MAWMTAFPFFCRVVARYGSLSYLPSSPTTFVFLAGCRVGVRVERGDWTGRATASLVCCGRTGFGFFLFRGQVLIPF